MSTYRSRTRDLRTAVQGTLWYNGMLLTRSVLMGRNDTCYDYTGWGLTQSLDLTHVDRYVCLLNGTKLNNDGTVKYQFTDYPASFTPGPLSTLTKYPVPNSAQKEELALKIAALTNPSVAHISVPSFIGELRDIPGMIKSWGDELLKLGPKAIASAAANGLLSWKFGIRPLINDLKKMMRFTDAVRQRVEWLKKLQAEKHLHRRCRLESDTSVVPGTTRMSIQSMGGSVMAYRDVTYTKEVWGTSRWNLDPDVVLPLDTPPLMRGPSVTGELYPFLEECLRVPTLAERLTYGFTTYEAISTLWQLMPWSWFVDWFSDVSAFIDANNNTLPLRISNIFLMRTLRSQTSYRVCPAPYTDTWITIEDGPWTEVEQRLERYPLPLPSLLALVPSVPVLDNGQLSIALSLVVSKFVGGSIPSFREFR